MEKTDNGRKYGQFVTNGPRQTAAERRQKSFAMAAQEFHCDASGRLFMEAFNAIAPPKRPRSPDSVGRERSGLDPHSGRPRRLVKVDDPSGTAA
jgi:hypothetical protein